MQIIHFILPCFLALILACEPSTTTKDNSIASRPAAPPATSQPPKQSSEVHITVDDQGYKPSTIQAKAGQQLTLVFKRISDQGCGQTIVFPELNIRRDLPLNKNINIKLNVHKEETITFNCGMGMYRGTVVATSL